MNTIQKKVKQAAQRLVALAGEGRTQNIAVETTNLTKSGLTRTIKVYAGKTNITEDVAILIGKKTDNKGIRVREYDLDAGLIVLNLTNQRVAQLYRQQYTYCYPLNERYKGLIEMQS